MDQDVRRHHRPSSFQQQRLDLNDLAAFAAVVLAHGLLIRGLQETVHSLAVRAVEQLDLTHAELVDLPTLRVRAELRYPLCRHLDASMEIHELWHDALLSFSTVHSP